MTLRNCAECGRLFQSANRSALCSDCRAQADVDLKTVRDYLDANPHATVEEVSRETSVRVDRITTLIRDGYLIATSGLQSKITCRRCGTPIPSGRFCQRCLQQLQHELSEAAVSKPEDQRTIRTWKQRH